MAFTTNLCRNPSLQMGLSGYSAQLTATISLDRTNVLYGNQSCLVTCPGLKAGEGVITPGGIIPNHATCSVSLFMTGVGTVTVSAVVNPGGVVAASTPVVLTDQWQRVKLQGISCTPGQTIVIMILTTSISECQFWISGIQVEGNPECHPYCDGDQDGCEWLEGFWGGISVCIYENPVVGISNAVSSSGIVNVLQTGQRFFISSGSKSRALSDLVFAGAAGPVAAVSDFAICQLTDPDPAQTYVSWNNAGLVSSTGGTYTRSFSVFYPPVDYPVSGGQMLYNRAAYAAVGWWFASVPNNGTVNLSRVQAEILPVTTGYSAASPSAFDPPRAIHSIIKPNRLNYCPNPSIEVSTAGWSATGSASIAKDNTVDVGEIIQYDDSITGTGTSSLNVTLNANGDGAQITIADLITGYTYIASLYVKAGPGLENIVMSIANGTASVLSAGGTGYGTGTYDTGPYGGINPSSDLPVSGWFRINCMFNATADSEILQVTAASALDVAYPSHMWIDAVMVEVGELLSFYFDGSFGPDYSWESGGTPGLTRSYWYDQRNLKQRAVQNILAKHTPLGILSDTPQYNIPYIQ